jgi:hypothetical protein
MLYKAEGRANRIVNIHTTTMMCILPLMISLQEHLCCETVLQTENPQATSPDQGPDQASDALDILQRCRSINSRVASGLLHHLESCAEEHRSWSFVACKVEHREKDHRIPSFWAMYTLRNILTADYSA